jgi:hypothetical protein
MVWWHTTRTVVSHWKAVGVWRNRGHLDSREKQRGSEGLALVGCPALEARG